jgi:hypothetical protein
LHWFPVAETLHRFPVADKFPLGTRRAVNVHSPGSGTGVGALALDGATSATLTARAGGAGAAANPPTTRNHEPADPVREPEPA